jgi:predicted DNA-binding transcriptional regulator YafY
MLHDGFMSETSTTARTLRLLELLQARRYWPGGELASRLGVTARTLRRDVERLRALGYHVAARRGPDGGYEIATGGELPPLVFTPDEAVAIAAALASSAASAGAGIGELALAALVKVEQVMPAVGRARMRALRTAVALGAAPVTDPVDPGVLATLAMACRDGERLRVCYTSPTGIADDAERVRRIEPARLVPRGALWYLLCWDLERADWRTLRVDRVTRAEATGVRTAPRAIPMDDAAAFVAQRFGEIERDHTATILIGAPLAEVEGYLRGHARNFTSATGVDGTASTRWHIADRRLEALAAALIWLPWAFEVLDSPELATLLREKSASFAAAAGTGGRPPVAPTATRSLRTTPHRRPS